MIIEGNEKEKAAMAEFHKGNRKEGLRLQEEFAAAFRGRTDQWILRRRRHEKDGNKTRGKISPDTGIHSQSF